MIENELTGSSSEVSFWTFLTILAVLAVIVWISNTSYRAKKFWHIVAGGAIIYSIMASAYMMIVRVLK